MAKEPNVGNLIWMIIMGILCGIVIVSSMSSKERGSMTYEDRVAIKEAGKLELYDNREEEICKEQLSLEHGTYQRKK